jgi:hypothetical protein
MPGLGRGKEKQRAHKQRVLVDGVIGEQAPNSKARAYQLPVANPAPFTPRSAPERGGVSDLPLWPGFSPDPTGRHETRYFDGVTWTDRVMDASYPSIDPFTA